MNVCTCNAKALRDALPSPLDTSESYSIACSAALRTLCKAGTGWRGGGSLAGKLFTNWLFPAIYLLLTVLYSVYTRSGYYNNLSKSFHSFKPSDLYLFYKFRVADPDLNYFIWIPPFATCKNKFC